MGVEDNGGWVGAGRAAGGVTSGRSQLGADIHEVDNAASRCGALLDQVAGDAEAALARKDELVAAMAPTAKPYFGDVAEMTYEQLLRRYLELSGPRVTAPGSGPPSFSDRFTALLDRALAGSTPRPPARSSASTSTWPTPRPAVDALVAAHPQAATVVLHPADVHHFLETCRTPGKPVDFVPSSTPTCAAGGARTRCGRPTTPPTAPSRSSSSPARSPSAASPRSTSRSRTCSTASRPPSSPT